jgi:flagellar basal body rod protein FlgC
VTTLSAVRLPSSFPLDVRHPPSESASGTISPPDGDALRKAVEQVDAAQAYKLNLSMMRTAQAMEALLIDVSA